MSLSSNTLVESYQYGLNRILKDKIKDIHFQRFGSLMIHLKKNSMKRPGKPMPRATVPIRYNE